MMKVKRMIAFILTAAMLFALNTTVLAVDNDIGTSEGIISNHL